MHLYKTFFVPSSMAHTGKVKKKAVPTGEKKKAFFGMIEVAETKIEEEFVPTGHSDCQVDGVALSLSVENTINQLVANGYSIINIIPIISGAYAYKSEWSAKFKAGYGYGYGFSYTDGMMIVASKMVEQVQTTQSLS
jgi:hypothetical protein